jgi:hypothetical protein
MTVGKEHLAAYKRKLIEVALPLEDISREAARRNPSATVTHRRCTCGGLESHSALRGPCSSANWLTIHRHIRTSSPRPRLSRQNESDSSLSSAS